MSSERQVRRVAAIRPADRERGAGIEIDVLEQRVDADAAPVHVELRPLRHAADVDRPLAAREREERLPRPADRLADEALDGERPAVQRRPRRRPGREHGEVRRQVLTGRGPRCGVGLPRPCWPRRPTNPRVTKRSVIGASPGLSRIRRHAPAPARGSVGGFAHGIQLVARAF